MFPAPGFSAMAALNAADMYQGTLALYTPTMMSDFLNHEDFDDYDTSVSVFCQELFLLILRVFDTNSLVGHQ